MAHLVIGDKGAEVSDVVLEISKAPSAEELYANWKDLARQLGSPRTEIDRMHTYLLMDRLEHGDVLENILREWRTRMADKATIENLCEAFRRVKMTAIADHLLTHFVRIHVNSVNEVALKDARRRNLSSLGNLIKVFTGFGKFKKKDTAKQLAQLLDPDSTTSQNEDPSIAKEPMMVGFLEQKSSNFPGTPPEFLAKQVGSTDIYYYPDKKRLGQGATSLVYQGYFGSIETPAAIKEVKKDENEIFYKELDIFMTIMGDHGPWFHHPNVVRLFLWTEHDDMLYFAMEQASHDLRNYIATNQTLDRKTMVKISFDTVLGLQFLHDNKILHRDIKPENILIFGDNEDVLAKLGDFGVSRKMKSITSTISKSAGTEIWMSPEAINAMHNDEPFPNTKALDIFSLGMSIYFTFSLGNHPFAKSEKYGSFPLMNIKDPKVRPIRLIQVQDSTAQLLGWMMQKLPKDRPIVGQVISHSMWKTC